MSGLDINATLKWLKEWTEALEKGWTEGLARAAEAAEESPEESDAVKRLRIEYGYKLLAKDADIEALTAELSEASQEAAARQAHLRKMTRTLQRAYDAHTVLHDALYGPG